MHMDEDEESSGRDKSDSVVCMEIMIKKALLCGNNKHGWWNEHRNVVELHDY